MKIGVCGKGGTGKTVITGTLARLLARRGLRVLAVDADSNPNLAMSLGVDAEAAGRLAALPQRAFEDGKPVDELLDRYWTVGPDGVNLVLAARIERAGAG